MLEKISVKEGLAQVNTDITRATVNKAVQFLCYNGWIYVEKQNLQKLPQNTKVFKSAILS